MSDRIKSGNKAETYFLHNMTMLGCSIAIPFSNDVPYDFIVDDGEILLKYQVKKAFWCNQRGKEVLRCEIRRVANNNKKQFYSVSDFDYLAAVDLDNSVMWFIPSKEVVKSKSGLQLSAKKYNKYKIYGKNMTIAKL